ncbi:TetR/AcrR family transcriptional regulator, partial [Streptomyces boncukensis]
MDETSERTRVLRAADALFYAHGIQAVGMDRIRDAAGISLKRLYRCFPSKEDLVEAYLRTRDQWARGALAEYVAPYAPHDRLLAVFDWLHLWCSGRSGSPFHGCAFIHAYGELGAGSERVGGAVRDHKEG